MRNKIKNTKIEISSHEMHNNIIILSSAKQHNSTAFMWDAISDIFNFKVYNCLITKPLHNFDIV